MTLFGIGAVPSVSSGTNGHGKIGLCTVWLQTTPVVPSSRFMLCEPPLVGPAIDLKLTRPPGVMFTTFVYGAELLSTPSSSAKKLSPIVTSASTSRASSPWAEASAGTPTAAMTAHANHGKYVFLIPRIPLR